jgi:hypothetical protein
MIDVRRGDVFLRVGEMIGLIEMMVACPHEKSES